MRQLSTLVLLFLFIMCIYSYAEDNEADFKVNVISETTTTLGGNSIVLPQGDNVEIESHIVEIKPGKEIGRHKHPYPVYMYVIEGTLLVELDDGTQKTYQSGEALIEDADTWVNNKNTGSEPVKFLAILPGLKDSPMVIMPEKD